MAETKKKPTLRKAPKGSLKEAGDGATSAKEAAQDVRALEQHEKAAAKKAVRDANEASKERKRQAKQGEKAAKAEAKAAAKKERAERKAQEKAARAEARERDKAKRLARKKGASEEGASTEAGAEAESGSEAAVAAESAESAAAEAAPAADGSETKEESFAEALERDLEDASAHLDGIGGEGEDASGKDGRSEGKGSSGPDVQFVSGDDAYDLPAPDRRGAARAAGAVGGALRRIPVGRVLIVAALALVVAAVVAAGVFSWNRWWRFDDVADFQGTWQYGDTPYQVTIDGTTMTLSKDAAYDYELDTFQKAVTFHFGDLKGHGSYAFSEDRSTLVIVDGRTPDIGTILGFTDITENAGVENDGTSTVIVLKRVGGVPAEEPAPQPAQPVQPADDASQSEGEGATTDGTDEGATSDEGGDESSESVDVGNLGNDPGEDTGSNVVTPEDLGITLTDEEEE